VALGVILRPSLASAEETLRNRLAGVIYVTEES
jgi:hypothetical protein